jgi:hypothetical protein
MSNVACQASCEKMCDGGPLLRSLALHSLNDEHCYESNNKKLVALEMFILVDGFTSKVVLHTVLHRSSSCHHHVDSTTWLSAIPIPVSFHVIYKLYYYYIAC